MQTTLMVRADAKDDAKPVLRARSAPPVRRPAPGHRFADPDMDLHFMAALGWGPAGGLDIGQLFHVASKIRDGDPNSWVDAFDAYGDYLEEEADLWVVRGHRRNAGEMRLKAFASYRSAWQFAGPGERFATLVAMHRAAFARATMELELPATFFDMPYRGKALPGVFLRCPDPDAPVALVIGGADSCFEELYLTLGRSLLERGHHVALVDLPGQGLTQADGLFWEAEAERPIAAVIDFLVDRFGAVPGRIALVGLSIGGYFAARAAGHDDRLATVIASTPLPNAATLFRLAVEAAMDGIPSRAARRSYATTLWRAGAETPAEFTVRTRAMIADPNLVALPFLSLLGSSESPLFAGQARQWHRDIRSPRKRLVTLNPATGANAHAQLNNPSRLAQECSAWMNEIFQRQDKRAMSQD